MGKSIFVLDKDKNLVEMKEAAYDREDLFQELIEKYPSILAGDQINPENPKKWIFVSREMGVPGQEGGSDQWFLDHLFIDQDAIPTFVEVKRSSDTRIRREVVAQMLDYAANAVLYWPVERIRDIYENSGNNLADDLEKSEDEIEPFWQNVGINLKAGKIRLLFAADEIPMSLQRIIEFLNEQMNNTEVLGLEIKQYVSDGNMKTLVPRIIGQTSSAVQVKNSNGSPLKKQWDKDSFLDNVNNTNGIEAMECCESLLKMAEGLNLRIWWGQGGTHSSFVAVYDGKTASHQLFSAYPWVKGTYVEIEFMRFKAPFNTMEKQKIIQDELQSIEGIIIPNDKLFKRPTFSWEKLKTQKARDKFKAIFEGYIAEVKKYEDRR